LDQKSECAVPPIELHGDYSAGNAQEGCWHPKTFDKAVVVIIDALRYDFTIPFVSTAADPTPRHFHNSLRILYEKALTEPNNAFLLPFIADPPTTTLQRLKGLTTGTLPTFIDAGSNFAGTAIEEDNMLSQLRDSGKKLVHLGDDTWTSLFPGYFEPNLTHAYDSFNVWDLHTVDNGVSEHLFPLLAQGPSDQWDVVFAHYLGVDHAGHRYGPEHPAMAAKLSQMDEVLRQIIELIDEETLLVVMGDHGMDSKGDHGGESSDEVEAALWMYSKRAIFGRTSTETSAPPGSAKIRPTAQIDLVPTLSLLLGLPIPFNNLGAPIEEAFIGVNGQNQENLATVSRLTSAQIHRYQEEYAKVRNLDSKATSKPTASWLSATEAWAEGVSDIGVPSQQQWVNIRAAFSSYQQQNLNVCRDLWARFDLSSMSYGILVLLTTFAILATYARAFSGDMTDLYKTSVIRGLTGMVGGALIGAAVSIILPSMGLLRSSSVLSAMGSCGGFVHTAWTFRGKFVGILTSSKWSGICVVSIALLSIGFFSNSYTVWEDEILLLILTSLGIMLLAASFRIRRSADRKNGHIQAIVFLICVRASSLSRLCRDEQLPYCRTTFYASATSSTSAPWQLLIPFLIAFVLPSAIKSYYNRTHSWHGSVAFWVDIAFRTSLFLIAIFWTLDAADNDDWFALQNKEFLKTIRTYIAQLVFAVAVGAGTATFAYQAPCISVETRMPTPQVLTTSAAPISQTSKPANALPDVSPSTFTPLAKPQFLVHGAGNLYGSHFMILPLTVLLPPLLLLQKPMGQLTLSLLAITILALFELLSLLLPLNAFASTVSPLGPTILALLAHYTFFKTGHQAALSSIQWDAAFVPLRTVRYPWSPLLVILNSFAGPILCSVCIPGVALWRRPYQFSSSSALQSGDDETATLTPGDSTSNSTKSRIETRLPQRRALLSSVLSAYATHILTYALINLTTTIGAAHLRRHLMLYRVFLPRWLLGSAVMLVAEVAGMIIGVGGVAWSVGAVGKVFGW